MPDILDANTKRAVIDTTTIVAKFRLGRATAQHIVQVVHDTLWVQPPPAIHIIPPKSSIAPVLWGALIGLIGAFRGQAFRSHVDDQRRMQLVIARVRSALRIATRRLQSILQFDESRAISADAMKILRIAWERYDRVSDGLHPIRNDELESEIDQVLIAIGALAGRVLGEEEQFRSTRREVGTVTSTGIEVHPSIEPGIQ